METYEVALETREALLSLFFPIVSVTISFFLDRSFGSRTTARHTSRYVRRIIVASLNPPRAASRITPWKESLVLGWQGMSCARSQSVLRSTIISSLVASIFSKVKVVASTSSFARL
jgi:hypothetical protein